MDQEGLIVSIAAEFNHKVLKRLQREFERDPEVDLSKVLPSNYSRRLAEKVGGSNASTTQVAVPSPLTPNSHWTEGSVAPNDQEDDLKIVFGLTREVEGLLEQEGECFKGDNRLSKLRSSIHQVIQKGDVLWRSEVSSNTLVVRCNDTIVVKIIPRTSDYTEFTSMRYLQTHLPHVPAPRLLGVVSSGRSSYAFMTYIPGVSLDAIWARLDEKQKQHLASQLNEILQRMRQQRCPPGVALGGVGGEGCKDARRHTRTCQQPIFHAQDFIQFLFSNPHFGGRVYVDFLQRFLGTQDPIVFTHGDLHPSNIMVEETADGYYQVTGLVDWERSGYYLDWFESVKATNDLSTTESDNDWSLFLPACISPQRYPVPWLLNRVWDPHIA